jgi:hypothetical protein
VQLVDVAIIVLEKTRLSLSARRRLLARRAAIVRAVAGRKIGLGENERAITFACERRGEHLFRTPLGVSIGGVEEVDAGLDADADEAAGFIDLCLAPGLENSLVLPNLAAPNLNAETLSPESPGSRYSMAHRIPRRG